MPSLAQQCAGDGFIPLSLLMPTSHDGRGLEGTVQTSHDFPKIGDDITYADFIGRGEKIPITLLR